MGWFYGFKYINPDVVVLLNKFCMVKTNSPKFFIRLIVKS
ncbi:hypothetical protein BTN49_1588 [Candidatus Enterovibrio escicola]|uniref:Uncharacterized protein n=1 Tax=Candidatus Enterovibrio escicola TaxID=1927127 RepID=A0A2A5T3R8_9GAMM|nr:hypothetical protein BTN49_1588 [Candidatus Enterovibrio escacola]